ncbi:MAG: hypothetical protein LC623_01435 [Halobacteriales archaeon]|nr:hypothetical protein [Halobacteriales archaeon]
MHAPAIALVTLAAALAALPAAAAETCTTQLVVAQQPLYSECSNDHTYPTPPNGSATCVDHHRTVLDGEVTTYDNCETKQTDVDVYYGSVVVSGSDDHHSTCLAAAGTTLYCLHILPGN